MYFYKAALGSILLLSFQLANAAPISDRYIGGDDHGYGDVIGSSSLFDVLSVDISRTGSNLTVDIFTNFAGRADDGLFSGYTNTPYSNSNGIGYGDLFLSTSWSPYGPAPYYDDNHATGTVWEYGISLDNRWSSTGGIATLYQLNSNNNDANALLSDDFLSGATYRNGQEVAVDLNSDITGLSLGNWVVDEANGKISFNVDITGTSLLLADSMGVHWGMTCGNDVIEAEHQFETSVPEPSALTLLLLGLIGTTRLRRKK